MLFNSIDFAVFLPVVFFLHWFVVGKRLRAQNLLIVVSSYLFYGWWDWRFLSLILFSTLIDYTVGIALGEQKNPIKRKLLLWTSILLNLGFLGFFKYYNFFLDNFIAAFSVFGMPLEASSLNIVLPVGISFYTFQTLSYSIDVYRRKLAPTKDFVAFMAFVSFFPQLVAGPIERATRLLPQFYTARTFDYSRAVDGMRQILWGLIKKVVIADNCAEFVSMIFGNSAELSGSTLVLGAMFFAFQVYGDFSGYSDIAIGTSRLFGVSLMQNFAYPFFSRDIAEFWRRWHISLSTWFRDYLYIPLGGSKGGAWGVVRNSVIVFVVSGFWHGAEWTFVIWGALNAIYFIPLVITGTNRKHMEIVARGRMLPTVRDAGKMVFTFMLVVAGLIIFRARNIDHAISYFSTILSSSLFTIPHFPTKVKALTILILVVIFMIIEWFGREQPYAIAHIGVGRHIAIRWSLYFALLAAAFLFSGQAQEFIYFQF